MFLYDWDKIKLFIHTYSCCEIKIYMGCINLKQFLIYIYIFIYCFCNQITPAGTKFVFLRGELEYIVLSLQ